MCSLIGIYWLGDDPASQQILTEQVEAGLRLLHNRGPDQSAHETVSDRCVLGGNRLVIRGDRRNGAIPLRSHGRLAFYNGEIYNYQGWNRTAGSDGEIILPLFAERRFEMFSLLDGEFAISIWEDDGERLILARDPFGTKPIYFSLSPQRLLWASSASAINAMSAHRHCAAVKGPTHRFSHAVQEPYTSYEGIWLVPPGHFLVADRTGARLFRYHRWGEYVGDSVDCEEAFEALRSSLATRLDHDAVVGIPMSAGIDSGIIAFTAKLLDIDYHIFSVVELFGEKTPETDAIYARIDRLKNARGVTLLDCGEREYHAALEEMFQSDYYDGEKFDSGNIPMHTVFQAMKREGIRVAIDGSGGDELFHGYKFRDDFAPPEGWPRPWKSQPFFYSLFTTLLDYTSKTDRAGAHFSIESRFPYQNVRLMNATLRLRTSDVLKWPLRKYLTERLEYGPPTDIDLHRKYGFYVRNRDQRDVLRDMQQAWCAHNERTDLPDRPPRPFPFRMGVDWRGDL